MIDRFGREFTYLRLSVTDRCNLYCLYCKVPELPRAERLHTSEILRIVQVAASLGVRKVRLTGGEPTLRSDIVEITRAVATVPGIREVVMTSNGITLDRLAAPLREAGLGRVNVSCDSLDEETFCTVTKGGQLKRVLDGMEASRRAGIRVKINCVVLGGCNDHEVVPMLRFAVERGFEIRFIEYMPMHLGEGEGMFGSPQTVPSAVLREALSSHFELERLPSDTTDGPAETYRVAGTPVKVGFISAMSSPFCESCNRLRITPEGKIRSCLLTGGEVDLVASIRRGASDAELSELFRQANDAKPPVYQLHQLGAVDMRAIGG